MSLFAEGRGMGRELVKIVSYPADGFLVVPRFTTGFLSEGSALQIGSLVLEVEVVRRWLKDMLGNY